MNKTLKEFSLMGDKQINVWLQYGSLNNHVGSEGNWQGMSWL